MKKKVVYIIMTILLILIIGLLAVILISIHSENKQKNNKEDKKEISTDKIEIQNYCKNYASDYKVIERQEDGTVLVSVKAPDFKDIAMKIFDQNPDQDITFESMQEMFEKFPNSIKEYEFLSLSDTDDDVKNGFMDKILEELMIAAITNVKYTGEGGQAE